MNYSQRELAEIRARFPERQDFFQDLEKVLDSTPVTFRDVMDGIYSEGKHASNEMTAILFFVMQLVEEEEFVELPIDPMETLMVSESVTMVIEEQEAATQEEENDSDD